MISVKKNHVVKQTQTYDSSNELLKFPCKIAGFTKATLTSSHVSVAVVIAQVNTHNSPPPPPKEKVAKFQSFSVKNVRQISAKQISLSRNFQQNRPFFTDHFSEKSALKISARFLRNQPFFPWICLRSPEKIHMIKFGRFIFRHFLPHFGKISDKKFAHFAET